MLALRRAFLGSMEGLGDRDTELARFFRFGAPGALIRSQIGLNRIRPGERCLDSGDDAVAHSK